jgi:hypothetical protein
MEAARSSETSANFYLTIWAHIPEKSVLLPFTFTQFLLFELGNQQRFNLFVWIFIEINEIYLIKMKLKFHTVWEHTPPLCQSDPPFNESY